MDYHTATMADVILRSLAMHPSMLADAMEQAARAHTAAQYAMAADTVASNAAGGLAADAHTVTLLIRGGHLCDADAARIGRLSFGRQIMLFTAAAHLQCLPHHVMRSIAERGA